LNIAQTSNTATGRVLNSIVEALKELRDNKTGSDGSKSKQNGKPTIQGGTKVTADASAD